MPKPSLTKLSEELGQTTSSDICQAISKAILENDFSFGENIGSGNFIIESIGKSAMRLRVDDKTFTIKVE